MKRIMLVGMMVGLFGAAGCSSSSDDGGGGGSCGEFTACGGNLEGTWSIAQICMGADTEQSLSEAMFKGKTECNGALKDFQATASGTVTFGNGTTSSDATITVVESLSLNSTCLSAMTSRTVTVSESVCQAFEQGMNSVDDSGTDASSSPTVTGSCTFTGSACDCTMTVTGPTGSTGTYQIQGNQFIDEDGDATDYCVATDTLTAQSTNDDGTQITMVAHRAN